MRNRKRLVFIRFRLETLLLMQTKRIIYFAPNGVVLKKLPQLIPLGDKNNELIVDMVIAMLGAIHSGINSFRQFDRRVDQTGVLKQLPIMIRIETTGGMPLFQIVQLDCQHGRLDRIEPEITANP